MKINKIWLKSLDFIKSNWTFIVILVLIATLRLWKVAEFFSFNFDEEYQGSLAWEQVKNFHPIWIGVSASNIQYYLGPGFVYLNAILFKLSNGDPVSLAWFSAILGLSTSISIYYVVSHFYSKKSALISMTLYGASAFIIFFDRRFWNPSPIPFITIWMIYSLIKGRSNSKWYFLSIALYAISFHVHLSLMLFVPIFFYLLFLDRKKIRPFQWLGMGLVYFLITLPMLVFDFVHNFDNLLAPLRYIFDHNSGATALNITTIQTHFHTLMNALGKFWFMRLYTNIQDEHCISSHCISTQAHWIFTILSILLLSIFIKTSIFKKSRKELVLLYGIAIYSIVFTFYSGYPADYFILALYVFISIAFGVVLAKVPKLPLIIFLTSFVLMNALTIFTSNQEQYGLTVRKKLIKDIMPTIGNAPFSLETYGTDPRKYHSYGGWRFLFKAYGNTPTKSFADEFFGWIYSNELTNENPKIRVVITDTIPYNSEIKPMKVFQEGAYYGYVFNSKK